MYPDVLNNTLMCLQNWQEVTHTMARLCNSMLYKNTTGNYVCQGFTYDYTSGQSYFKAQLVD